MIIINLFSEKSFMYDSIAVCLTWFFFQHFPYSERATTSKKLNDIGELFYAIPFSKLWQFMSTAILCFLFSCHLVVLRIKFPICLSFYFCCCYLPIFVALLAFATLILQLFFNWFYCAFKYITILFRNLLRVNFPVLLWNSSAL